MYEYAGSLLSHSSHILGSNPVITWNLCHAIAYIDVRLGLGLNHSVRVRFGSVRVRFGSGYLRLGLGGKMATSELIEKYARDKTRNT